VTRLVKGFTKKFSKDEVVLFEDLLKGDFKTFVTSKGQATCDESQILASFAHFTYHASCGQLVVCNLKGVEKGEGTFYLTNPVIHSRDDSSGDIGMQDFFQNHICTQLCHGFPKPAFGVPLLASAPEYVTNDPYSPPPYNLVASN